MVFSFLGPVSRWSGSKNKTRYDKDVDRDAYFRTPMGGSGWEDSVRSGEVGLVNGHCRVYQL